MAGGWYCSLSTTGVLLAMASVTLLSSLVVNAQLFLSAVRCAFTSGVHASSSALRAVVTVTSVSWSTCTVGPAGRIRHPSSAGPTFFPGHPRCVRISLSLPRSSRAGIPRRNQARTCL